METTDTTQTTPSSFDLKAFIKEEYRKCLLDPVYFAKKYCFIQHAEKGKIKFNLYPFQEQTIKQFLENRYNIVLKSRQLGLSTLCALFALWYAMMYSDKNILIIATTQATAKNMLIKVHEMYDNLPVWLRSLHNTDEDNKLTIRFKNGSQIKAVASTEGAVRSEALSLLIADEYAFIQDADTIWTAAQPALSTGGSTIILSTPNGKGNSFHRLWSQAITGENQFNTIKLPWTVHPERDQRWRDEQTELLGEKFSAQECDAEFASSGATVVDQKIIQYYIENYVADPIEKRYNGDLWIWAYPDYSKTYVLSADVARGDHADYSAFHVIDVETLEQVAEYKGKLSTKDFGHMLVTVATEYNNALLAIENSNIGWATIQVPIDMNYANLYYSLKDLTIADTYTYMVKGYDLRDRSDMTPGFTTSYKTRPLIISKIELLMLDKSVVIKSKRTIAELEVFVWINGKAQAQSGYHDDLIMSLGIGLFLRDTAIKLRNESIALTKQSLTTYGSSIKTRNDLRVNPWIHQYGNNESMDLTWLLGK